MSIWCRVAVSARAGKEHLVPCCSFSSCRQGALVLPFMLVQTRSVVPLLFRLVQARSLVVLPFMLVQTRSIVPCSLGSCRRGALVRAV
ncbi:hypothetical protein ACFX14_007711 [Malus domestica]